MDISTEIQHFLKVPYRIGILLLNDFSLMSYASTVEPYRAANMLLGTQSFKLYNYSVDGNPARSSNNAEVPSLGSIYNVDHIDMLLVVAGGKSQDIIDAPVYAPLKKLAQKGTTLGGVSGGPLLLAAAGLMEGRRMTVHWEHREALQQASSKILIERSIYVIDRNRVTCAGGIAPLDLGHALIADKLGVAFARKVSDWFLHTEVRNSQSAQKSSLAEQYGCNNRLVIEAIELMKNHIAEPLTSREISSLLAISSRQLNRVFANYLNKSPQSFYLSLRLDNAKRLLQHTSLSITDVAHASGFSGSAHFSSRFKIRFGYPPSAIRKRHNCLLREY